MKVEEACRKIETSDGLKFEAETFEGLEKVSLESKEEKKRLVACLVLFYWKLPKTQAQEDWVRCVVGKMGDREDSQEMLDCMLEHLKEIWLKIDIRRKEKFVVLVEEIVGKIVEKHATPFEKYIRKGPNAQYDVAIMKKVVSSRKTLEEHEVMYLVQYLIRNADTYFRNFFLTSVVPVLEEQGVSREISDIAYVSGKKSTTSAPMRETLYAVQKCYKGETE